MGRDTATWALEAPQYEVDFLLAALEARAADSKERTTQEQLDRQFQEMSAAAKAAAAARGGTQ